MAVQIARKLFSVEDYHSMIDAGIVTEDDRIELLGGEIVEMSPIGSRHAAVVNRLNHLFNQKIGSKAIISVQNPIQLEAYSEPEPDIALLKPRKDFYASDHPKTDDVQLIVEVAETSMGLDREIKIPLYAQAGVREVWHVVLVQNVLEVYRKPVPERREYQSVTHYEPGDSLSPLAFPNLKLSITEMLK